MRGLAESVAGDDNATAGLRKAAVDYMLRKFTKAPAETNMRAAHVLEGVLRRSVILGTPLTGKLEKAR